MDNLIQKEFEIFESEFKNYMDDKIDEFLKTFLFSKSKRLRPLLGILFSKCLDINLTEEHKKLFFAVEIVHNASLLHDDVIDNSPKRRNKKSINSEYNNSLAISSGDLLLAIAMDLITDINKNVQKLFVRNISEVCKGEIGQYFSKFKTPALSEYIKKSERKTALLFEISILGALIISEIKDCYNLASEFSKNFGIAFQIKNDLENFINTKEDYIQGIYTAPIIYGEEKGIEKTKNLINNYLDICLNISKTLPNNIYSESIAEIIKSMRE